MGRNDGYEYLPVDYDAVVRETDKAVLLRIDGEGYWIPWSCLEDNGELNPSGGQAYIIAWLCEREGLT